jgi:hypothetical protein
VRAEFLPPEEGMLAGFYLEKAEECMQLAEVATDPRARDQWLKLAEGWRRLATSAGMR